MIQLANDVFATKNDPEQLDVDETVIEKLRELHRATISEYNEGDGPIAWVLAIPTTLQLMQQFLHHSINEQQLAERTVPGMAFEAVYLCSALVLEEYRRKGIAEKLALDAIKAMEETHKIEALFVWPFTPGGDALAERIAQKAGLPLLKRTSH